MLAKSAQLSDCGKYRYTLERWWDTPLPPAIFIGLNPSTADASIDDPTIRRCIGFAKSWKCGGLVMLNLFAIRSTDPNVLYSIDASMKHVAIGTDNEYWLKAICQKWPESPVVAAWGTHGARFSRGKDVLAMMKANGIRLQCLGVTLDGHPKHPLYLKATTSLIPFGDL